MAAFNPLAPEVQPQNFTRTSEGVGTSHVFSTLFGGIGALAGKYADAKDEANKRKIYDEAVAGRDKAAQPLIDALVNNGSTGTGYTKPGTPGGPGAGSPGKAAPPAVDDNGKPIKYGVGQGNISAGQGTDPVTTGAVDIKKAPQEIQAAAAKRTTLDQALASGTITQAYWDLQMDTMGSNLHTKYPGYGMEIDAIVKNVVGFDPKNAMVGDFFEQARANAAGSKTAEDKWQTYLQSPSNRDALYRVAPDVWSNPKYDDPAQRDHIYYLVAQDSARLANLDVQAKMNSNKAAQGNLTSEDMHQSAMSIAGTIDRQAMQVGNQTYELNKKLDFWSKNPNSIDPEEVKTVLSTANAIRKQNQDAFNEWWTRGITQTTNPDGSASYTGLTNGSYDRTDNAQEKGLKAATANIDAVIARIQSKDYGLAGLFASSNELIIEQKLNKLYTTNAVAVATKLMEKTGGQALVARAGIPGTPYAEGARGLPQAILDISAVTAGGNTPSIAGNLPDGSPQPTGPMPSLTGGIKSLKDSGLSEADQAKVIRDHIGKMLEVVQTKTDPEVLNNVVNYLFGPENGEFIQTNVKPGERSQVFSMLTSPAMSDAIKKASANNPELLGKYSAWVAKSFKVSFGTEAANIQRAITDVPGANTTWDAANLRLVYNGKVQGPGNVLAGGNILTNIDRMIQGDANQKAKDSVDLINAQLASIKHIAELSGIDGNEMVAKTIKSLDIDFKATPNQSVLESIWGGVTTALNPLATRTPGNPFKEVPSSQSLSVLPTGGSAAAPPSGATAPGSSPPATTPAAPAIGPQTSVAPPANPPVQNASLKVETPAPATPRGWDPAATEAKLKSIDEKAAAAVAAHPSAADLASISSTTFVEPLTSGKVAPEVVAKYEGKTPGKVPISIRANNMGAISIFNDDNWVTALPGYVGKVARPANEGGYYAKFATPEAGVHAASILLERYGKAGTDTPMEIVKRWSADPNAWAGYAKTIAQFTGAGINDTLDLSDPHVRKMVLMAQSQYESGVGRPVYNEDVFDTGVNASENSLVTADASAYQDRLNRIKSGTSDAPVGNPMDRNLAPTPRSGTLKPQPDSLPKTPVFGKLADAGAEMMGGQAGIKPAGQQVADNTQTPAKLQEQLDAVEKQIKFYTGIGKLAPAELMNQRVKLKEALKGTTKTG